MFVPIFALVATVIFFGKLISDSVFKKIKARWSNSLKDSVQTLTIKQLKELVKNKKSLKFVFDYTCAAQKVALTVSAGPCVNPYIGKKKFCMASPKDYFWLEFLLKTVYIKKTINA